MSDVNRDPEEAARKARELLEQDVERRVQSVKTLVSAINDADAADQAARDAADAHAKAWNDAIASGWNERDLKATGARAPGVARTKKAPRRRRMNEPSPGSAALATEIDEREPVHA
ncbi:hypothetical protein HQQ80_01850 [Microbacteriaceae bacterium VKM Ac-2855]|nr:hypothetical protein [Microbacteriaceae bacterium VKM Ac-2855]